MATKNEKKAAKPEKTRRFHPVRYVKEVIAELKKLTWPTKREVLSNTGTVFAFLIGMSIIIGALDYLFVGGVNLLTMIGGS